MQDFLGTKTASAVNAANEVIVKIYLLKGVHYYITCTDTNEVEWSPLEESRYKDELAVLCLDYKKLTADCPPPAL